MPRSDSEGKGIKSAETVFDILEVIAEGECTTVSAIADRLDYSKSTIHYYLKTMERNRYVINEEGQYRLGLRIASFESRAKRQYDPQSFIQERADDLAREVGMAADVVVEEARTGVVLYRSRTGGDRHVETHVGMEVDLPTTAFGKAILAFLPSDERAEILSDYHFVEGTDDPSDAREELRQELEKVRQVGIAYAEEGFVEGVSSIAAPIVCQSTGEVYGAIGIWGRTDEMTDPTRHAKARRFAGDTAEEVEKVARILGDRI